MSDLWKFGLLAVGVYLLYRYYSDTATADGASGVTLPADSGMYDGEGGGGGGGGSGGGDYQTPPQTLYPGPGPVKTAASALTLKGVMGTIRTLRNAGTVKPAVEPAANPEGPPPTPTARRLGITDYQ